MVWSPDNDDEVHAAETQFDILTEANFKAFAVKKNGDPGKRITEFDPEAGMIIMVPQITGG